MTIMLKNHTRVKLTRTEDGSRRIEYTNLGYVLVLPSVTLVTIDLIQTLHDLIVRKET